MLINSTPAEALFIGKLISIPAPPVLVVTLVIPYVSVVIKPSLVLLSVTILSGPGPLTSGKTSGSPPPGVPLKLSFATVMPVILRERYIHSISYSERAAINVKPET